MDEETILEWAAKESKKYVSKDMSKKIREKVAPFIKWLKEAEQDDDDEDEDECNGNGSGSGSNGQAVHSDESPGDEEESPHEEEDDGFLEFSHRVAGIQLNEQVVENRTKEKEEDNDIDIDNI